MVSQNFQAVGLRYRNGNVGCGKGLFLNGRDRPELLPSTD